ncbi:hypothetical protein BJ986_002589 [Phycicoccus badiiscoriae]|uniref:Uncharacterized protein n=1 Tax=Pedococcus badiiscoriae TaxID=642776 RepID=A0A852WSB1_9MICO|nr:hypothetical protein [Pedococcus badiiscoriae]NYG08102.1 hypothetical protein [Pedococcus badiiscoriae]
MNTTQQTRKTIRRTFPTITAAALLVALVALPAAAHQDPGPAPLAPPATYFCAIQRVDTQFVGCDNLTGNGVPAPAWVGEVT